MINHIHRPNAHVRSAARRGISSIVAGFLLFTGIAAHSASVTAFDPSTWPRTDAALGVAGFTIEDFEDTTLVPGLQVQLSGGSNDYGPTGTVPKTFDPNSNADDPNGAHVLASGIWDGSHVLMNRKTAVPNGYVDGEWADITFLVAKGASSIGFSAQQIEVPNTTMTVTTSAGTSNFNLSSVPNFTLGSGRNGYLRIDAAPGERIFSVKIDNLGGDGFAFDHLAFQLSPASLVAHWKFDEPGGATIAQDTTGSFPGTLAGGAAFLGGSGGGISGNAISLDKATNSLVKTGAGFPGFTSGDFSVVAWVKTTDTSADTIVLSKADGGTANGYALFTNASGGGGATGKATFLASDMTNAQAPVSTTTVTDGQWHQLVGVYHAGGTHSVYVDGAPAEASTASNAMIANSSVLVIGGLGQDSGNGTPRGTFSGLVDDVQVYRGALTDAEIDFLFAHPGQDLAQIPTPIAHYKFDEATGTTAEDSVGTFDGTLSATGAAFVSGGISGNAISLNRAANGFVNMGTSFPGFTTGDFTLVTWVKTTTTEADTLAIAKHEAFVTNGYFIPVGTTGGGGVAGKATFYASDAQVAQSPTSTTTVNDGNWHQLVGVYRAGAMHSIYVDGAPAEASTASQAMIANSAPFLIGGVNVSGVATSRYTGLIDDVQVYDVALTDSQIDYLFTHPGQTFGNATYDLVADWSDAMNPNCTWTYREGGNALPHVDSWQRNFGGWTTAQPGWAKSEDGNDRVPFWFKSNGSENFTHDWLPGDVVVHTNNDPGVTGNGNANVIWTSPFNGTASVAGGVWMGADIGRGNDWFLYKNSTLLTQGHIDSGDAFSRASPFQFSAGSGGAAVLINIPVAVGDVIKLEFVKTSTFGYLVGVNMTIIGGPVIQPDATTLAATAVTGTGATLNGTINPNDIQTSSYFEIGSTTSYGTTTPTQNAGSGGLPVSASANLSGLSAGATYHFRLVAMANGCISRGADMMFTALTAPTVSTLAASAIGVRRATVNGTVNPNGAATNYHFEYGATGSLGSVTPTQSAGSGNTPVAVSAFISGLTGGTTYDFRLVAEAGGGTFPGATLSFDTITPGVFAVAARDDAAPGAAGATFFTFGPPAINDAAHFAFRGTLTSGVGGVAKTNDAGIWAEIGGALALVAREGDTAPGATGTFSKFGDPVFARGDRAAFIGRIKPGPNTTGIWSHIGGTLTLVARQGAPAPGVANATFASFTSLGLLEFAGPAFIAKLKGVDAAHDTGIWRTSAAGVVSLAVREGDAVTIGGAQKTIKALQFLPPVARVGGQTRGFNTKGLLAFRATFTDKTQAVLRFGGTALEIAASGDAAPGAGAGAKFGAFSQPAIDNSGRTGFRGTLASGGSVAKSNDTGIWLQDALSALQLIARESDNAPGTPGVFASFSDPVFSGNSATSFLGKLKPGTGGVTSADAAGIWSDAQGALTLVARQGSPAPGAPAGTLFSKFTSLALPNSGDAIFLAKLKHSAAVKKANDSGIWAADDAGAVSLVTRTGDALTVGAGAKTVRLLQFLPTLRGVPGQTRNFNDDGYLAFRAVFTDGSEAVFRVVR